MIASLTNLCSPLVARAGGAALLALIFADCAQTFPSRPAIVSLRSPVGEVAIVNLARRFVLIDIGRAASLPPIGAELSAKNPDGEESARLRVTPEQRPPFITADIVSGTPERGDRVFP